MVALEAEYGDVNNGRGARPCKLSALAQDGGGNDELRLYRVEPRVLYGGPGLTTLVDARLFMSRDNPKRTPDVENASKGC